jgi:glucose/arabinose dehydrogenase
LKVDEARMTRRTGGTMTRAGIALALLAAASGCYGLRRSSGGGAPEEAKATAGRRLEPRAVALPAGYRIEVVATGLTFPTGVAFDGRGVPHVVEAGYSYGEAFATPRLVRVEGGGRLVPVAEGKNDGPWTGVAFADGAFFVAAGGELEGGRLLRISPEGEVSTIVEGLPSLGDHHTNGPAIGPDGRIYFGQGTATNSGVVGPDNADFGWLKRHPEFHDTPCADVTLTDARYASKDPLRGGEAVTGPFQPFGTAAAAGQVVRGAVPCNGAILRVSRSGGHPELVAWGFRNPFGLAFAPDGRLFVTENGYDVRGSRPVFGAPDVLWEVKPGTWYGWPDFSAGEALDTQRYQPRGGAPVRRLLAAPPNAPPRPAAVLPVNASSNGLDFSRSARFGYAGEAFIAEFGDMTPNTGKVLAPVGFKVVRVDPATGVATDFAVNRGATNGPASRLGTGGLERPVAVRFDPSGDALYVVDFGIMTIEAGRPQPRGGTGVLWRITRAGAGP